jgi:hypothetical protein
MQLPREKELNRVFDPFFNGLLENKIPSYKKQVHGSRKKPGNWKGTSSEAEHLHRLATEIHGANG